MIKNDLKSYSSKSILKLKVKRLLCSEKSGSNQNSKRIGGVSSGKRIFCLFMIVIFLITAFLTKITKWFDIGQEESCKSGATEPLNNEIKSSFSPLN